MALFALFTGAPEAVDLEVAVVLVVVRDAQVLRDQLRADRARVPAGAKARIPSRLEHAIENDRIALRDIGETFRLC